jgi:hypothetical protein
MSHRIDGCRSLRSLVISSRSLVDFSHPNDRWASAQTAQPKAKCDLISWGTLFSYRWCSHVHRPERELHSVPCGASDVRGPPWTLGHGMSEPLLIHVHHERFAGRPCPAGSKPVGVRDVLVDEIAIEPHRGETF